MSNQALKKKVNELLKTIFYLPHYASLLTKASFKKDHAHFSNMCRKCCFSSKIMHLNALFCLKNNIFEFFSTQIFAMNLEESIKTIFYLPHYASLLSKASFKIYHAHFSNMCLLKCIILLEKQHFRIFQHSNIRNETRGVNKNHFLSSTLFISVKVSKFQNRSRPLFKTVSSQMHYFP